MIVVPAAIPDTTPVVPPIVATDVLLLDQLPTPPGLESVVVAPIHTVEAPVIAAGLPLTTNVASVGHPDTL
jgi:hypothetical protein